MKNIKYLLFTHLGRIMLGAFVMALFYSLGHFFYEPLKIIGYVGLGLVLIEILIMMYYAIKNGI